MSDNPRVTTSASGQGARRGAQVLARLRERPPALWYQGELVRDVTVHPALRAGVHSLAALYDLQWQQPEQSLFTSPTSGRPVARSFMIPKTQSELRSITRAMQIWQQYTHGMMGRAPDYLNRALSAFAGGAAFFSEADPRFGQNAVRQHEYLREHDLCLTHSVVTPQSNRAVNAARQADPYLAARSRQS